MLSDREQDRQETVNSAREAHSLARGPLFGDPGEVELPESARELIESDALAHLATVNPDGSPQVSCIWVGLDGDEIVSGHLRSDQQKLRNIRRDPRVTLSIEGREIQPPGLKQYIVLRGHARLEEGGAPELLQRLARTYLGPDVRFPPMDDPPPGHVMRISVERIGGVGPWAA
jgi:PPOX class probable F420-dependent enzyme